jgi:hypothetical protein
VPVSLGDARTLAPAAEGGERVGMSAKPFRTLLVALTVAAGLVAGCGGGQSQADKASAQVCTARDNIAKNVDQLKGMTLSSATTSQIKQTLQAIKKDLTTIADAQGNLSDKRRSDVKDANQQFKASVTQTVKSVGSTVSVDQAKGQLKQAFDALANTYRTTLGKVDCA